MMWILFPYNTYVERGLPERGKVPQTEPQRCRRRGKESLMTKFMNVFAVFLTALFFSLIACDQGTTPNQPDTTVVPDTTTQPDTAGDDTAPDTTPDDDVDVTLPEMCTASLFQSGGAWQVVGGENSLVMKGRVMQFTSETAYWEGTPQCVTTIDGEGSPYNGPLNFVGDTLPLSTPTGVSDTDIFMDGPNLCLQVVNRDTGEVYIDLRYSRQ